ncbi:WecB/TagA/CpsF family glycosyltransferase [Sphingobium aquiterrae]|uniref:WecB/TagA/CpsF family glycosyltransferase n=1 Tax=Sphingobium aquiterrae TaxID=2038656 RepID=UPI003016A242
MTVSDVLDHIDRAITAHHRLIMANLNVHGMAVMFDSPVMARLFNQSDTLVMIDSMPLVFLANMMGHKVSRGMRTTSLDFYDDMFALAVRKGWKIGYVGADPATLAAGMDLLHGRFPGLQLEGRNGFFDMADLSPGSTQAEIIDWLKAWSPDLVIVGMGMPRQEEWIHAIQQMVDVPVFLPTGAYLDFQVGTQKMAPRWMGQYGLEWIYRLLVSPRRLGYRYLIEPLVLTRYLMFRRHPQDAAAAVQGS